MWRRHELPVKKAVPLGYGLFGLLLLVVFIPVRSHFAASTGSAVRPEQVVQALADAGQDDQSRALWQRLEPTVVAFNRINQIITDQIKESLVRKAETPQRLERRIDKVYLDNQVSVLSSAIARESEINLYLLGHYASEAALPEQQALALILIRELYPKKTSVFYANSLVQSSHPLLKRIANEIIYDRYTVEGPANKVKTGFFLTGNAKLE